MTRGICKRCKKRHIYKHPWPYTFSICLGLRRDYGLKKTVRRRNIEAYAICKDIWIVKIGKMKPFGTLGAAFGAMSQFVYHDMNKYKPPKQYVIKK